MRGVKSIKVGPLLKYGAKVVDLVPGGDTQVLTLRIFVVTKFVNSDWVQIMFLYS